jgi:hypothetical protein
VDLTIKSAAGVPLHMWTLTNASDIIGTTVGGNRYGWFPTDEFPFLAFDNSALVGFQDYCVVPPSTAGAKINGGGWIEPAGPGTVRSVERGGRRPPAATVSVVWPGE